MGRDRTGVLPMPLSPSSCTRPAEFFILLQFLFFVGLRLQEVVEREYIDG
jgi:hypothetical protein